MEIEIYEIENENYISEVRSLLEEILKDTIALKTNKDDLKQLTHLIKNLHTIKGNSKMLGYTNIEKLAHATEDIFKNVNIINGHTKKTDVFGVTAYSDFPLWPDEETMDRQHYIWKVMNDGFTLA